MNINFGVTGNLRILCQENAFCCGSVGSEYRGQGNLDIVFNLNEDRRLGVELGSCSSQEEQPASEWARVNGEW